MKKISIFVISLLALVSCSDRYADDFQTIRDKIEEANTMLAELCEKTNANMEALQAVVAALETRDYITSIETLYVDGVEFGYEIHFLKGDPVTIVHGIDGRDGEDGSDGSDGNPGQDGSHGADGNSIKIGVKQGNDGNWYWTVDMGDGNGERWMRDADGNKVKASPDDGKDGEDGEDGKDGQDGQDGADGNPGKPGQDGEDGVTPRMKIENGYWYLSLDGGKTWTEYGKATGDDGLPGPDAVTPEVLIEDVRWDDNYAYFTLKSGEIITIPIKKPFGLQFDQTSDILVAAGTTVSVLYSIIGVDDETEVYCVCEGGWKAEVVKENFFSGYIAVRAPYPFADGKVLVMAQNAADDLVMQSLTFKEIESEPVFLSYCDDPEQLDGWEEAVCTGDGAMIVGKSQEDGGYLVGISEYNGDNFALISLAPEGYIRELCSPDGISLFENNAPIILTKSWGASNTAGALGLFNNIVSIYEGVEDIASGGKLSIAGVLLAIIDHVNNVIKTISGEDIFSKNPYLADTLKYSGGLVDIAGTLSGASWLGVAAIYANLLGTYLELYEEHIKAYYGNCTAQVTDIEVDGSTVQIKVSVAGWESHYNTLEVGIAVSDLINASINESSQIQALTHNGEYVFTESGLKVGATYHCRPFVADKSRESLWIGWIGDIAGPLIRYGSDRSFSIPRPSAYTGDAEDITDATATVACSFGNVPSGASCGVEIDESRKVSAGKDAKSVVINGLTPATSYKYRAYVSYQGVTYYGSSKSFSTDLPDVSGTWTCKEKHTGSDGSVKYVTYSVTLSKDGTAEYSEMDDILGGSWSRSKTNLGVNLILGDSGPYGSMVGLNLNITFDDCTNPTSGKGDASHWAYSNAHGTSSSYYYELEMSR